MFIPGFVITLLTFPGVIVHEFAHQLFCRLYKVPVFEVVYFQLGNPAGYVMHEAVKNKAQGDHDQHRAFHRKYSDRGIGLNAGCIADISFSYGHAARLCAYLSWGVYCDARFPEQGDANVIWNSVKDPGTSPLVKFIAYPIVGLIYLGSLGSFFWLDLMYGVGVAVGLPNLLIYMLA
ncbi:DUF3267 domain-containing protein [Puia sp. P3]|uniref:DUF3267 domain-containing protein n=1 Tax=Puia sp. P3 TaxID=3423952 RepID=UPI003D6735FF